MKVFFLYGELLCYEKSDGPIKLCITIQCMYLDTQGQWMSEFISVINSGFPLRYLTVLAPKYFKEGLFWCRKS